MTEPKPDVPQYGKIEQDQNIPTPRKSVPNEEAFQSYMEEPAEVGKTEGITPMDLGKSPSTQMTPTPETVMGQADSVSNQLTDIQNKLNTPKLKIKSSHEKLLESKLTAANEHLNKAGEYLGAKATTSPDIPENAEPVAKFLGFIASGQNQLLAAKQKLQSIQAKGGTISPSEMMLVQVNLSQAQQQIEFSSILLSKVVGALKQTLSIQL